MEKIEECVDLLKVVRKQSSYSELSDITGLPKSTIARYVKGHIMPSYERACRIINIIYDILNIDEVLKELNPNELSAPETLKTVARHCIKYFNFDCVACYDNAAPIATAVAILSNSKLAIIRKNKFYGIKYISKEFNFDGIEEELHISKDSIENIKSIVLVQNILSRKILYAVKLFEGLDIKFSGIFSVWGNKETKRNINKMLDIDIRYIVERGVE